jgi:hypothetical protein
MNIIPHQNKSKIFQPTIPLAITCPIIKYAKNANITTNKLIHKYLQIFEYSFGPKLILNLTNQTFKEFQRLK